MSARTHSMLFKSEREEPLILDKNRGLFVARHLINSESNFEVDRDPQSEKDLIELKDNARLTIKISDDHDGDEILQLQKEADEISEFVSKMTHDFFLAYDEFESAVEDLDELKGCLSARRLRASAECLTGLHPELISEEVGKAAELLLSGWGKLREKADANPGYLHNILIRHLYLQGAYIAAERCRKMKSSYEKEFKAAADELRKSHAAAAAESEEELQRVLQQKATLELEVKKSERELRYRSTENFW